MKKAIALSALAVLASASAFAQGHINFSNSSANRVFLAGGTAGVPTAASGGTYLVELLFSPDANATDAEFDATATRQGLPGTFNIPQAGVFSHPNRTVATATPGGVGKFQVRVWDTRAGATYELAWASGDSRYQAGKSPTFNADTADVTGLPIPPAGVLPMPSFNLSIIPEPSLIALGLLAAGALLLLRRRK